MNCELCGDPCTIRLTVGGKLACVKCWSASVNPFQNRYPDLRQGAFPWYKAVIALVIVEIWINTILILWQVNP